MTKRILAAAAAAALIVPAIAFAQVEVTLGERAIEFRDAPSTLTRDQVRAEMKAARSATGTPWKYVGGEAGSMKVSVRIAPYTVGPGGH